MRADFSGIGILSAAVVLVVKKGDPVAWLFGSVSSLLAGVYCPVTILPDWLEPVSRFLPMTYALDAMKLATLKGASLIDLRLDVMVLAGLTVVLRPRALLAFRTALARSKMEGSLVQYQSSPDDKPLFPSAVNFNTNWRRRLPKTLRADVRNKEE